MTEIYADAPPACWMNVCFMYIVAFMAKRERYSILLDAFTLTPNVRRSNVRDTVCDI